LLKSREENGKWKKPKALAISNDACYQQIKSAFNVITVDMDKSPSTSKKSSHRSRSPLEDLIKCFCGACESFFKRKHVKQALKANECETLKDTELRDILKKFVEFKQAGSHIKPPISDIIECYELCEGLLCGDENLDDRKDDLEDLCFTEAWEDGLSSAIDEGTTDDFYSELMAECTRRLGEEPEYQMFKEELEKKLKKKWFISLN